MTESLWQQFFDRDPNHHPAADAAGVFPEGDAADAQFWAQMRADGVPVTPPDPNPEPGSFAEKYADACAALDGQGPGAEAGDPEPEAG